MLTRSHAARKERRRRKSEMKRMLAARMAARQEAERQHLDAWFREFDKNDDRRLDKKELAALLMTLQPEAPPSDETLDRLMREAKLEDDQHEPVHREQLARVVLKNLSYVKEAQFIDTLFDRFDEDKSGSLDRDELKGLMHSIALGDVKVFPPGDPAYAQAACIAYKFKCLEDLMAKGVIDEPYFREKRARVVKRHTGLMSPRLRERDPEPHEVDFVIEQVDTNNDNRINKEECMAALGMWMQVMKDDPDVAAGPSEKSHACALM